MKNTALLGFEPLLPTFVQNQESTLDWIALLHQESEAKAKNLQEDQKNAFLKNLKSSMQKVGLNEDRIQTRYMFFDDFFKDQSHLRRIYDLNDSIYGKKLDERMVLFDEITEEIFSTLYLDKDPPSQLIHTTCTGYSSPSPAQKLVSKKNWGAETTITHAYHMGCYASIPSIRIADSFISAGQPEADIVHTEFCSLHMNPSDHRTAQLVIESLFADGAIYYQAKPLDQVSTDCFHILTIHEELISDSLHGMSWQPSHFGFSMNLSKDVPLLISKYVKPFVLRLFKKASKDFDQEAIFAIHPGGPKIIDYVAKYLELEEKQYQYSTQILKKHGNMSSATLPHVWDLILKDKALPEGTLVISLAFGPGLTMAGAIFEIKRGK